MPQSTTDRFVRTSRTTGLLLSVYALLSLAASGILVTVGSLPLELGLLSALTITVHSGGLLLVAGLLALGLTLVSPLNPFLIVAEGRVFARISAAWLRLRRSTTYVLNLLGLAPGRRRRRQLDQSPQTSLQKRRLKPAAVQS